jgi:Zn-dependent protease
LTRPGAFASDAVPLHTLLDLVFENPTAYFVSVGVLVGSIVLHELGHALVATWEGDPTPKIRGHLTWNPVVHMGWFSLALVAVMGIGWGATPVTRSMFRHRRWGDVLVSAAGPAVNLFLAILGALMTMLAAKGGADVDGEILQFWFVLMRFNVLLFLLNLIPLPPLDGFHVAEGAFDLGNLGAWLKSMGMFPLIAAILIVNSDAFDVVIKGVTGGLLRAAKAVVGA